MNYYNYFTEIEEHFVRRRGKHMYVSPLDWSLIATWRDSGVPLHVALRGIDRAMDGFLAKQPHHASRVSSLFYCHASVMEEYARHLDSHVGEERPDIAPAQVPAAPGQQQEEQPAGPGKEEVLAFLSVRIREIKAVLGKQLGREIPPDGIDRIVLRLEEIVRDLQSEQRLDYEALDRDLAILDEALTEELRTAVPAGQFASWEQEAKQELKIYKKKLPKETYEKILENFRRARIHRHFEVGELSLFHM